MKNVLILCGGRSPEHEISLRSARNILKALDRTMFQPTVVGITPNGKWILLPTIPESTVLTDGEEVWLNPGKKALMTPDGRAIQPDVVFPALHGPNGEDGAIQGLLQMLDVPYVGPNILGSAVCMDKAVAKALLQQAGIQVARGAVLQSHDRADYAELSQSLGNTLFVKPANMGSSVGVHKVRNAAEFEHAVKDAFRYDTKVIVEEMIKGREVECAVKGLAGRLHVTDPGEIRAEEEYSFDEKYSESSITQLDVPAKNLAPDTVQKLKETALQAFEVLNCEVMARVDMFLTADGRIYVNEINTLPGFTSISMYPALWQHEGLSYSELLTELLTLAAERHERTRGLKKERL